MHLKKGVENNMDERHSKLAPDLIAAYKNTLFQAHVGDDVITLGR